MSIRAIHGDCRDVLKTLAIESVHCVVTSPPFFGLRDYGVAGQIGLEATPDAYVAELVAVFREVRRVLRDDGTLWLNLGDSYSSGPTGSLGYNGNFGSSAALARPSKTNLPGLKPKDLIGIPWAVATALRDPYYTGKIKNELDRVWMAAMIDGEGTICGFRHVRPDGNVRTGCLVFITNSSEAILDNCERIWPGARYLEHLKEGDTVLRGVATRPCWRWQIQMAEDRALFLREIFPYLVEKRKQAIVGYALCEIAVAAKRYGRGGDANGLKEKRDVLVGLLSDLNNRRGVCDLPNWLKEPPSPTEPGYYLRQDIIWSKRNPMPESVRDRCTKAHEYLFLLSKSPRYFYDAEAIAESSVIGDGAIRRIGSTNQNGTLRRDEDRRATNDGTRNRRSVWEVATQPFSEAHFATFPPALIEPCIKAGCPAKACAACGKPWVREVERLDVPIEQTARQNHLTAVQRKGHPSWSEKNSGSTTFGLTAAEMPAKRTIGFSPSCSCNAATVPGVVLDPFGGAGTTGLVADRLGRDAILIELNEDYAGMSRLRIADDAPLFAEVLA